MMQVLRLTLGLSLAFPILAAPAAPRAPSHAVASAKPDSSAALVGTWEGEYTSDHAPKAPMRLAIGHDKDWSAKIEISMGDAQMQSVPVSNVTYSSSGIAFNTELMQQACETHAALKENALHGTVVCGMGSIAFVLTKKEK